MMGNVFMKVLREIGIGILILVILAAVIVIAFKDQLPYDEVVPTGKEYVKINQSSYKYNESTDRLSEIDVIKITHETEHQQIISAENDVRIQTGKYTPFGTISTTTDLPSETVGVAYNPDSETSSEQPSSQNTSSSDETLEYPISSDLVEEMQNGPADTEESAAARRMNIAE